jgi:hypothetical protein
MRHLEVHDARGSVASAAIFVTASSPSFAAVTSNVEVRVSGRDRAERITVVDDEHAVAVSIGVLPFDRERQPISSTE